MQHILASRSSLTQEVVSGGGRDGLHLLWLEHLFVVRMEECQIFAWRILCIPLKMLLGMQVNQVIF